MYCKTCAHSVPDAPYCGACGTQLPPLLAIGEEEAEQRSHAFEGGPVCAICGASNHPSARYCTECGEKLQDTELLDADTLDQQQRARLEHLRDIISKSRERGEFTRAILCAREALGMAPGDATLHVALAEAHFGKEEYGPAVDAYRKAVEFAPENTRYRERLASYEKARDEQAQSISYILEQHPGDIAAVMQALFTRKHEKWYMQGWANIIWAIVGLFLGCTFWYFAWFLILFGPVFLKLFTLLLIFGSAAWVWVDATRSDMFGPIWFLISILTWPLGFLIYYLYRI